MRGDGGCRKSLMAAGGPCGVHVGPRLDCPMYMMLCMVLTGVLYFCPSATQ